MPSEGSRFPSFITWSDRAPQLAASIAGFATKLWDAYYRLMACSVCDNTGWVCEEHPDRPWRGTSQRADACDCVRVGMPCECNPCGGIDEPPAISPIARVTLDTKNGPRN